MKGNNQTIKCSVDHCRHYDDKYCTLDKIKVAKCSKPKDDESKEATMCDSYDAN